MFPNGLGATGRVNAPPNEQAPAAGNLLLAVSGLAIGRVTAKPRGTRREIGDQAGFRRDRFCEAWTVGRAFSGRKSASLLSARICVYDRVAFSHRAHNSRPGDFQQPV